jgi:hypothetical protein
MPCGSVVLKPSHAPVPIGHVGETDESAQAGDGGDIRYLNRWMRESGLADLLPSLHEAVLGSLEDEEQETQEGCP